MTAHDISLDNQSREYQMASKLYKKERKEIPSIMHNMIQNSNDQEVYQKHNKLLLNESFSKDNSRSGMMKQYLESSKDNEGLDHHSNRVLVFAETLQEVMTAQQIVSRSIISRSVDPITDDQSKNGTASFGISLVNSTQLPLMPPQNVT